jgi:sugar phosphate isomerase/epimerase
MELKCFKTLWGHTGSMEEAIESALADGFDGIEGPAPSGLREQSALRSRLADSGLGFIAEICTAGSYVPDRLASMEEHIESFRLLAEHSLECAPLFITAIAGCDAWPFSQSVDFFRAAIQIAGELDATVSFETHRSRSMFHPWVTRDLLLALPDLRLTCDFSHWCCVCERLISTEPDVLKLCAERAHHIHARVGYEQGPQVPHPAAPEYRAALEAHEEWWDLIWQSQSARGQTVSMMTPEFGPDGYLHCTPFTGKPVADPREINRWMAARERERFAAFRSLAGERD